MGQVSVLEMLTLHVDEGQRMQASIKEKVSNLERGWEKWPKTRASQPTSRRKTLGVKKTEPCMNSTKNPPLGDQGLAFQTHALQMILFGPFYVRTQYSYGSLPNRVLTILINKKKKISSKFFRVDYKFSINMSYILCYFLN